MLRRLHVCPSNLLLCVRPLPLVVGHCAIYGGLNDATLINRKVACRQFCRQTFQVMVLVAVGVAGWASAKRKCWS